MEVALPPTASTSEYALAVMRSMHLDSEVVTYLSPGTVVTPLTTCVLDDGTRRASISLQHIECHDTHLPRSGWLTTEDLEGKARIHRYGRPIYEVAGASLKVRRGADTSAKFVRQLAPGTRLHIAELQQLDGTTRALVVVLGLPRVLHEAPLGWVTVKTSSGVIKVVELHADGDGASTPTTFTVCDPPYISRPPPTFTNPVVPVARSAPAPPPSSSSAAFIFPRGPPPRPRGLWADRSSRLQTCMHASWLLSPLGR